MLQAEIDRQTNTTHIAELFPGLEFSYAVWGEMGPFGDFPRAYKFRRNGRWLIAATVIEEASAESIGQDGHLTEFSVFADRGGMRRGACVLRAKGVILPRIDGAELSQDRYGTYPVQESYATRIEPYLTTYQRYSGGNRPLTIPRRNINKNSLSVVE